MGKKGEYVKRSMRASPDKSNPGYALFDSVVEQLFGGADNEHMQAKKDALQAWSWLAFTGDVSHDKFLMMTGAAGAGKTTISNALIKALGDYACPAPPELFMGNATDHPVAQDSVRGRRLMVTEELQGGKILIERLNAFTGGAGANTRGMHENFSQMVIQCLFMFVANRLPKIGMGMAVKRRILFLRIPKSIQKSKVDTTIRTRLSQQDHAAGIISWMMEGKSILEADPGVLNPEFSLHDLRMEQSEGENAEDWIEDHVEFVEGKRELSNNVYGAYTNWCKEFDYDHMDRKKFSEAMRNLSGETDVKIQKSNGQRYWTGLMLNDAGKEWAERI